MHKQILNYVKFCHSCIQKRGFNASHKASLMRIPIANRPIERIAMDILGPLLVTLSRHKYILVITDYFARWLYKIVHLKP
ncbi:hypothetical protein X975_24942, partial [Stegodyphus mimosarum]